jgi:regulator of protease activity HflC (stomatin/prohibitin superfamily)
MPDRRNFAARLRKSMGYNSRLLKADEAGKADRAALRQEANEDSRRSVERGQAEARKKEAAPKKAPQKWVDRDAFIEELPW